jgi:hypothetical protein
VQYGEEHKSDKPSKLHRHVWNQLHPCSYAHWRDNHPEKHAHEIDKLQEEDYEVITVESTNAALTLLKKKTWQPALVVTDMRRREGLTCNRSAGLDLMYLFCLRFCHSSETLFETSQRSGRRRNHVFSDTAF